MKKTLFTFFTIVSISSFAQGFSSSSTNWSAPDGGKITGGTFFGYNNINGQAFVSDNTGSQTWILTDMNGDKRPDLLVTAQIQGGDLTCFSPGLNQYWKVYLNTAAGFSTSPVNWSLPNGGRVNGGIIYGFDNVNGTALTSNNTGSQSWSLMDMNADNKPDLVVTAQLQAGNVTCFSPGSGQYWKVFLNTGNSFSTTPINWNLPNGGKLTGGITYGYNSATGTAFASDNTGSQSWSVMDMDGDAKLDLIVTAQLQAGVVSCFSPGSGQYWKVFLNSGNGFASTGINWNLPNGGKLTGGTTFGFSSIAGTAAPVDNTGSQTWSVADIDGDKKPDLIIAAQLQSGNITCFSPGSNQYWKVYLNNTTEFAALPVNWSLPNGGKLTGGITYGFNSISGTASSSDNTGSQSWSLIDMDGYPKPELVITAQLQAGDVTCFSPGNNQYWKVFSYSSNGFSMTPLNLSLPNGGRLAGGVTYGFNNIANTALQSDNTGSQSWSVADMDGDNINDLIVAGQLQAGNVSSFSPTSSQYWKIYTSNFVTDISEYNSKASSFMVFPNPNNGSFTIKGSMEEKVAVTNEIGQLVKTLELNSLNNFSSEEITDLVSGVYFVTGKNSQSKLIVIK